MQRSWAARTIERVGILVAIAGLGCAQAGGGASSNSDVGGDDAVTAAAGANASSNVSTRDAAGVNPCAHDVTISDSFAMTAILACTKIGGDLKVSSPAISDLSALSQLIEVAGDLDVVDNNALTSIEGLSSLTHVGGSVGIRNNPALKSLKGLTKLTAIGGSLVLGHNKTLTDLDGFSGLKSVGGLYLYKNAALADLKGLANIGTVMGSIMIEFNASLATCLAAAFHTRLVALGFSGTGLILGNNDGVTCN